MDGEIAERWQKLCGEAAMEQDPHRLMELVREISTLLARKEERLKLGRNGQTENPIG